MGSRHWNTILTVSFHGLAPPETKWVHNGDSNSPKAERMSAEFYCSRHRCFIGGGAHFSFILRPRQEVVDESTQAEHHLLSLSITPSVLVHMWLRPAENCYSAKMIAEVLAYEMHSTFGIIHRNSNWWIQPHERLLQKVFKRFYCKFLLLRCWVTWFKVRLTPSEV